MTEADGQDVRDSEESGAQDSASVWERASDHFRQWRSGDQRAMDDLVRCMTPVLWHVVRSYGLERERAEDVVQSTWMTLVRRHESIADERAIAGWLTTCARRDAWKTSRADRRADPTEDDQLATHLPSSQSAESRVVLNDRNERLWSAVHDLDDRCRRLLRIVAFEDRPDYAQIASDLSMPVGSIGPTRRRCLDKLRTSLSASGVGNEP